VAPWIDQHGNVSRHTHAAAPSHRSKEESTIFVGGSFFHLSTMTKRSVRQLSIESMCASSDKFVLSTLHSIFCHGGGGVRLCCAWCGCSLPTPLPNPAKHFDSPSYSVTQRSLVPTAPEEDHLGGGEIGVYRSVFLHVDSFWHRTRSVENAHGPDRV